MQNNDVEYIKQAIIEAEKAREKDEIPIGAVVVFNDEIIGRGHNLRESLGDPTLHAEMIAIRQAASVMGNWRLIGCTIYVTLEPCAMCAGAIINGRLDRVCFGAYDPKAGCCGTLYDLTGEKKFNHHPEVEGGIMERECATMLTDFFKKKRDLQKKQKSD